MALSAILDSIDDLPEDIQKHYVAGSEDLEGKYILGVTSVGGYALEDVKNLKSALSRLKEEHRTLKSSHEGIDPEEFKELKAKNKELEEKLSKGQNISRDEIAKEERDKVNAQWQKKFDKLKADSEAQIKSRDAELESITIDSKLRAAIEGAGGDAFVLMPHARSRVRSRRNGDGKMVVEVLDSEGNPGVGGADSPSTIEELVSGLSLDPKFKKLFAGSGASGSGAPSDGPKHGGGAPGSTSPRHKGDFKSDRDKAAWINEHGLEQFQALENAPAA